MEGAHVKVGFCDTQGKTTWVDNADTYITLKSHLDENPPFDKHIRSRLFSYDPKIEAKNESTLGKFSLRGFQDPPGIRMNLHPTVIDYETSVQNIRCECQSCTKEKSCGRELLDVSFGICSINLDEDSKKKNNRKKSKSHPMTRSEFQYSGDMITFPGTTLATSQGPATLAISLVRIRMICYRDLHGLRQLETFRFGPTASEIHLTPISYVVAEVKMLNKSWDEVIRRCKNVLFILNVEISDDTFGDMDRGLLRKMIKYAQTWDQFRQVQQQQLRALQSMFSEISEENKIWFEVDRSPEDPPEPLKHPGPRFEMRVEEAAVPSSVTSSIAGDPPPTSHNFPPGRNDPRLKEINAVLEELRNIGTMIEVQLIKETRKLIERTHNIISIDEAYRSRDQNESIKRLSWVTFIFLPLLLVASLFGMNVDILANDPSWTYFLAFSLPMFCIVMLSITVWKRWEELTTSLRNWKYPKDYWYPMMVIKRFLDNFLPKKNLSGTDEMRIERKNKKLVAASGDGDLDKVRRLVRKGADVNFPVQYGPTALQAAARKGHLEIVKRLIKYGADVNAQPNPGGGFTALQAAAGGGYLETVKHLLDCGALANAEAAPDGGRTALQAASEGGHEDIVKLLINSSTPALEISTNDGRISHRLLHPRTTFYYAKDRALLKKSSNNKANVNAMPATTDGRTALQAAAEGGYIEIVKRLLNSGANVNTPLEHTGGSTALQVAAGKGHNDIVELLIEHGAKVTEVEGYLALKAAAGGGHLEVAHLLISSKVEVNQPGILQAAAHGGHIEMVELLINKGADVNATIPDKVGTTLSAAAVRGYNDIVVLLINKEATIDLRGQYGNTALQVAAEKGQRQTVDLLVRKGADVNAAPAEFFGRTALQAAAGAGEKHTVELLIRLGAHVNAAPGKHGGRTALQAAAEGGQQQTAELLIRCGALVNAASAEFDGYTALETAVVEGRREIVKLLIDNGAVIDGKVRGMAQDIKMRTPQSLRGEYERIIKILGMIDE